MNLKYILSASIQFFAVYLLQAQPLTGQGSGMWDSQMYINDVSGRPMVSKYIDVEGSPYFLKEFKFGNIVLKNGRQFTGISFRIDLVANLLNFISANGIEAVLSAESIKEISFIDSTQLPVKKFIFQTGFAKIDQYSEYEFCQVLAAGTLNLIKRMQKKIDVRKNELSGEQSKEFATYEDYYLLNSTEMKRIKRDKSALLEVFTAKRTLMEDYIKNNKGSFKSEDYLIDLFRYYNTLFF